MSDTFVELNLGTGGDKLDAELLAGGTKRERMQVAGALLAEVARVKNTVALAADYALVTREAPRVNVSGVYFFSGTVVTVTPAAQNGTTAAAFWLQNPVGSGVQVRLRHLRLQMTTGSNVIADQLAVPRILLSRFTFTGTASGAQITVGLRKATDSATVGTVRTASTGMTVSLVASMMHGIEPALDFGSAASTFSTLHYQYTFEPIDESSFIDCAPGEGVVLFQADAGTSDNRRFSFEGRYDHYTP